MKDKLYISFLKDLGLYRAYQISRVKDHQNPMFNPSVAERSYNFAGFVDRSFTWATSVYGHIWSNLNSLTAYISDADLKKYIIDGIETDEIKNIKQEINISIEEFRRCQS